MPLFRKAWLIHPPGRLFQRGEDRSQGNIEDSSATSLRAPNDLAYLAAALRQMGVQPVITDYPAEKKSWDDFEEDMREIRPDLLIFSTTQATIIEDMRACRTVKSISPQVTTVAKGALFLTSDLKWFNDPIFEPLDYALTGEAETIIGEWLKALQETGTAVHVRGVMYRDPERKWIRNAPAPFVENLDTIPFPARDLLKNELYVRPDTGEPQATIQTSRGCTGSCIYCLTPLISGQKLRLRSAENIADEIEECIQRYGIRNFFFKADTFTMHKPHVIGVCQEIIRRGLDISWVANSRTDTLDEERLEWMHRAGCWLVAIGFESGSDASLKHMKKYTQIYQAFRAAELVRRFGMKVYGFFLIGFPWENREDILETLDFADRLECDYAEIHIAVPYEGTELYRLAEEHKLLPPTLFGHDYFSNTAMGTIYLTRHEILRCRRYGLRRLFMNPRYILRRLKYIRSWKELMNHTRYGIRLFRQIVFYERVIR